MEGHVKWIHLATDGDRDGILWTRWWNFGIRKELGIIWTVE